MNDCRFQWSDAWLLHAIILGGDGKGASLTRIISTGDVIQHAMFTAAELEGGLARLSGDGYITEVEERFYPTEKALNLYDSAIQQHSRLPSVTEAIAKGLHTAPWSPSYSPGENSDSYPSFSIDRLRQAEEEYRAQIKTYFAARQQRSRMRDKRHV